VLKSRVNLLTTGELQGRSREQVMVAIMIVSYYVVAELRSSGGQEAPVVCSKDRCLPVIGRSLCMGCKAGTLARL
jgi:hypothetical protein